MCFISISYLEISLVAKWNKNKSTYRKIFPLALRFSVVKLIIGLCIAVCTVFGDVDVGCSYHDDNISTLEELEVFGCLPDDTCIVRNVEIPSEKALQVNTNRDVHDFKCLVFVNSSLDEIPSSIFSTMRSNISQLYVNSVNLKELKRVSILFGQNLEKVSLARNSLSGIFETIFYDSCNLKELDLSDNQLEKFLSNAFEKLSSLEKLDLSGNNIYNIPFELFQNLNNLVNLNMRHNRLQLKFGIFPEFVQTLDLSYNNIDIHFKFKIFSFLDNLEILLLHGNRIENIHFSIFNMISLKELGLSDNLFSCNMLADIFEIMKQKNVKSVPERIVHDTSNIRGIKCVE